MWPGERKHIPVISHVDSERDNYDAGLTEIRFCPWCGRELETDIEKEVKE